MGNLNHPRDRAQATMCSFRKFSGFSLASLHGPTKSMSARVYSNFIRVVHRIRIFFHHKKEEKAKEESRNAKKLNIFLCMVETFRSNRENVEIEISVFINW